MKENVKNINEVKEDKIRPIVITDGETGDKYTLEFSREAVVYINRLGFKLFEIEDNMEEMLPLLFHGAFRMHHRHLSKQQTDNILVNGIGGLTDAAAERLVLLYGQPRKALYRVDGEEKNARMTVEL